MIGCTSVSVGNILNNITKSVKEDDMSKDWNFVDDSFRMQYYKFPGQSQSMAVFITLDVMFSPNTKDDAQETKVFKMSSTWKIRDIHEACDEEDCFLVGCFS
jgi:hypothetical protein